MLRYRPNQRLWPVPPTRHSSCRRPFEGHHRGPVRRTVEMSPHSRTLFSAQPPDSGLYRREFEHDACGVALIATMRGSAGHDIVEHALTALRNLDHRGATGADPLVGDGAGILL